jgi:hypothetical protein
MPGYSETPLAKKLGIKASSRITFLNAPEGFRESLGELPANVKIIGVQKPIDLIVFFPKSSLRSWLKNFPPLECSGSPGRKKVQASRPIYRSTPCSKQGWRWDWWTIKFAPSAKCIRDCALSTASQTARNYRLAFAPVFVGDFWFTCFSVELSLAGSDATVSPPTCTVNITSNSS